MCDSTGTNMRATSSTELSLSDALVQLKRMVLDNKDSSAEDTSVEVEEECLRISQRNQLESPLLRLPAELRNQIYGYCLLHSSTLRFRWKVAGYGGPGEALDKGAAFSAGITFACRQTRAESASVTPVKSVTFECRQNTSIINDFVSRCTAAELEAVTSICITRDKFHSSTGWATSHYQGFKFLRLFPSLHKLAIVLKVHGNHNGAGNSYFMTRYILSEMGERFKDSIIDEVTAITTSVAVVVEVRYRDLVASA